MTFKTKNYFSVSFTFWILTLPSDLRSKKKKKGKFNFNFAIWKSLLAVVDVVVVVLLAYIQQLRNIRKTFQEKKRQNVLFCSFVLQLKKRERERERGKRGKIFLSLFKHRESSRSSLFSWMERLIAHWLFCVASLKNSLSTIFSYTFFALVISFSSLLPSLSPSS